MSELKDSWKQTGTGLGHAFKNLGKTLINTGKTGVDKAVEWAESGDSSANGQTPQQPQGHAYQPPQQQNPNRR